MANKSKSKSKSKSSKARKSRSRVQDAFGLATKQEEGYEPNDNNKNNFNDAVIDASKFLKGGNNNSDGDDKEIDFQDEELDSDAALGSDDEYDILNSKFSQTIRDGNDDDEDYESIDEDELIPLSEVWDRDDKDIELSKKSNKNKNKNNDLVLNDDFESDDNGEESESEEEDDDEEVNDDDENPFDEMELEDDDGQLELDNVMSSLKKVLPKGEKRKKSLINDKSEENQFSLPTAGNELTFDDMMADLEGAENDAMLLQHDKDSSDGDNDEEEEAYNGEKKEKSKAFAVPLPVSIQKRQERKAAYEIQKDQIDKWKDIINSNKRKEVLKFDSSKVSHVAPSSFAPSDKPLTSLEAKIDSLLEESNIESKKTEDLFEKIETSKISKTEMLKKTNELRLMRELMYRGQKDSKRLKKIKSKAFRKELRKERLKNKALVAEAEGEDENDAEEALYQRAKERMTLKHKNTSQWAKSMLKSGMMKDAENREEVEEMLRQNERLRMKQLGKGENIEDDDDDDDRNLSDLENDINNSKYEKDDGTLSKVGKGVLAMDFMKKVAEREKLDRLKEIEELRRLKEGGSELDKDSFRDNNEGVDITINNGRRVYTPSALVAAEEAQKIDKEILDEIDIDESRSLGNKLAVKEKTQHRVVDDIDEVDGDEDEDGDDEKEIEKEINPWLVDDEEDENKSGKKSSKVKVVDVNSSKLDKSEAKISKKLSKIHKKNGKKGKDEDEIIIENKQTLTLVDPMKKQKAEKANNEDEEYESDGYGEDDIRMFKQSNLIKEAFAGDDVIIDEFEHEKEEIQKMEGDKEIDLTLPGWGSWGGDDFETERKNKKRRIVKTVQGVVAQDKRKDKNKKNVIINERVNKKNVKYQADKVPYPYKTWDEYERSLRMPVGQEWTTKETFQKMTMPRVITKFGSVIDPLKAPFKD